MEKEAKHILITGGTGFIGSYLCEELLKSGHFLTMVTRSAGDYRDNQAKNLQYVDWGESLQDAVNRSDIIINLVGENLFGQRWSDKVKKRIYDSRIENTRKLVQMMSKSDSKPELFISASGISIYGDQGDKSLDESNDIGDGFLAEVCRDWESEALKAQDYGVRVAIPRIGIVLEKDGGFLEKMKLPFMLFVGGPIGSGKQYIPWIHMSDLCRAIIYPIDNFDFSGPFNACAPSPVTMDEIASEIGKTMNRPSFFRVPEFALKLLLGEAASPALESLRVYPKHLQLEGFEFQYENLGEALADIL